MKKVTISIIIVLITFSSFSQESANESVTSNVEVDNSAVYKLFPTTNMYNFIKLNTSTGQVYQVQWNFEEDKRMEVVIYRWALVESHEQYNGRFTLYPTDNTHNFLLLDQFSGKIWQVQWSFEPDNRFITPVN